MLDGHQTEVMSIDKLVGLVDQAGERQLQSVRMVQFASPPRSGKSSLLNALKNRYDSLTPVGSYRFNAATDTADTGKILDLMMLLLSAPRKGIGALEFPRLQSVRVATANPDPPPTLPAGLHSLSERARYFQRLFEDPRRVELVGKIVDSVVEDASKMLPPGTPGTGTARFALQNAILGSMRLTPWGRKRLSPLARRGLGPWSGMITGPERDMPGMDAVYHTLACLAPYRESGQKALIDQAEIQPWLAFLADLHTGYQAKSGRTTRAILLLDDADLPAGTHFLDSLARAAADHDRHAFGPAPLLVIAMGRYPVERAYDFFESRQLEDLSRDEVKTIVRRRLSLPGLSAAEDAVPVLGSGHRGITEDMLDICGESPSYPFDLTCGVKLRGHLLHNVENTDFTALVAAAPALEVGQVEQANLTAEARGEAPTGEQRTDIRRILKEHGWLLPGDVTHPAMRNLLLRRLAEDGSAWEMACQRLRDHPPRTMKPEDWLGFPQKRSPLQEPRVRSIANGAYYDLASGNVGACVDALHKLTSYPQEWVAAFDWITSAPQPYGVRYHPGTLADGLISYWLAKDREPLPPAAVGVPLVPPGLPSVAPVLGSATVPPKGITSAIDPVRKRLVELVVPCWLGSDRQLDPFHELDQHIADAYRQARPLGSGEFDARGDLFSDKARSWRHEDHTQHPRPTGTPPPCQT